MTIIKIDDKEYDSSQISKEAKDQFDSLRFVEAELQRLQAQAAVLQTARGAYLNALRQALTAIPAGVTIKLG